MRAFAALSAAAALGLAIAVACSSPAPIYPACARDDQCAVRGRHDYCVGGRCVYCRTSVDCGDREMCAAGTCKPDPNAPPPPVLDAGSDGEDDGSAEAEAGEDDETNEDPSPPESPRHVLPRGVRRFFHP